MDLKIVSRIATDAARYSVDEGTGCWNWLGARLKSGHGVVRIGSTTQLAHRVFFRFFVGVLFASMITHHRCHNPACVNPTHLEAMTREQHNRVQAESRGKLSYALAREIRELWASGLFTQGEIGKRYNVDHSTVSGVVVGRSWRNDDELEVRPVG